MAAVSLIGYLAFGAFIAYLMNASFDINKKWIALPVIALIWPIAIFAPVFFIWAWIRSGSH